MKSRFLPLLLLIFVVGCQSTHIKTQKRTSDKKEEKTQVYAPAPPVTVPSTEPDDSDVEENPSLPPTPVAPVVDSTEKWALILGPGGALTIGHVGVLRQFQKMKVQPSWIVGVEWASPWAALYSVEGSPQSIDWQLNKLKDSDFPGASGWLGDKETLSVNTYSTWLKEGFQSRKLQNSKINFLCPSFNLSKKTTYIMNRGEFREVLQFCWPYPPTLKAGRGAVAAPMALGSLVTYLRKQGVQKIILVNVMGNDGSVTVKDEQRDLLWGQIHEEYSTHGARAQGVDEVIEINLGSMRHIDFKKRKEIIESAEQKSADQVQKVVRKFKL
ncbi:MAG: hypothetical protein V4736_09690 [Bdellovibrionota bacterium]